MIADMIESVKGEQVRVDNFVRFSSLFDTVYTHIKGREPYAITVRRAFNRHVKASTTPTVSASSLVRDLAVEMGWNES